MSFADQKRALRTTVHATFAVPILYYPGGDTTVDAVTGLTARLHTKIQTGGDMQGGSYALIIEGVTRAAFNADLLALAGVTLNRKDVIKFPDYGNLPISLTSRVPSDGPVDEVWNVSPYAQ